LLIHAKHKKVCVGVKGQGAHIYVYIRSGVQSEDVKQPEDR